ncbi:MAG: hypothetical protein SFU91_12620 [Chloroherpetonaceae bacterium]|nr:hypothetical protein [Chloroherpetonaceae bacterium]
MKKVISKKESKELKDKSPKKLALSNSNGQQKKSIVVKAIKAKEISKSKPQSSEGKVVAKAKVNESRSKSSKESDKKEWILAGKVKPLYCDICNAPTPRTYVGEWKPAEHKDHEVETTEVQDKKYWLKCQVCGQVQLFEEWRIQVDRSKKLEELKPEDCVAYSPQGIYVVGDAIYHKALDKIGVVTSKQTTASGSHTIMVQFEGIGLKQFLENVPRSGGAASDDGESKKRLKLKRTLKR